MSIQKKVLVVEDDSFLSDIYKSKLSLQNYEVTTASDGQEALVLANQIHPDLIILDVLLPKKNGVDVLKQLKKGKGTRTIPVIIASNLDKSILMSKGLNDGAAECFVKSDISLEELIGICNKHLHVA